ncbi:UNKNOWN [Stylonychia lemnae]|uniref:Trafficking protein particle complex subunit 11 n=1 Tax=Stylonychia lemnae TaxID=5949 RepID=A0A078BDR6_STYLE|nr:UNKNOWN [Stylonychia lemnae]|eukprot:CDW91723.1 UNKNOWN [Stylonychia lemnae]
MYNIQSYEFYDSSNQNLPIIYRDTSKGDRIKQSSTDLGFLKYSFFKSLTLFKPAVTIIVFDWQHQSDSNFDWKAYEAQVLAEIKSHQDKCPGARQSKIVLLIFLPLNDQGSVDEKITSLKRAVAQRGDDNIKTFFLLTTGFEGLKNISKKFVKILNDLSFQHYREKKMNIKKKQKKLIKDEIGNIRYSFKHGIFSSYTKTDIVKPVKYMKEGYVQLRQSIGNSGVRTSYEEKRENADLITIKICQMLISNGSHAGFIEMYRQHLYTYQTKINLLRKEQRFEELKWRANWMRIVAQFLEMHPINEEKQEYFPGFYNVNSMMIQISRKQEYERICREKGDAFNGIEDMKNMVPKYHNFIGKDCVLQDMRDPLGGNQKTQGDQKSLVEKFKIYLEGQTDVNSIIIDFAQKAIQHYKNKSRQLKGNSASVFKRVIHFISYHISEHVLAKDDPTGIKTKKYRGQIARSLINEGWIQEELIIVERAKANASNNLEEFFLYEMEVLNHDKVLTNEERNGRFMDLLNKVRSSPFDSENVDDKPLHLISSLIGPKIIWSRGNFDLSTIQVNKYNKVNIEIHSNLDDELQFNKIILRFNENTLNQEILGEFQLSKQQPVIFTKELYISKDNQITRDFIQLQEIQMNISNDSSKNHDLSIIVKPYLIPEQNLLEIDNKEITRKPVRVKDAIKFNIEPMPSKIKFSLKKDENEDQALLGDYYNIYFQMLPDHITITDFCMLIENIDQEVLNTNDGQLVDQNLMISQQLEESKPSSTTVSLNSSIMNSPTKPMNVMRQGSSSNIQNDPLGLFDQPLGSLNFSKQKSNAFKDVELFYEINPDSDSNQIENQKLQELDYSQENHKLQLPLDARSIRIASKFYLESQNSINILFRYSFTQNSDKEDQKQIMRQQYRKALKIKSQSPFKISWDIKNSDPFIQNLKLRNEQLQIAPLVAANNEESWVVCTLTSQSQSKVIYLKKVDLHLLCPSRVQRLQSLDDQDDEAIRLEPGESFEKVFKIKINTDSSIDAKSKSEIEQFSDLYFSWYSQPYENESIPLGSGEISTNQNQFIQCTIPSPSITLIDIPIKIKILNEAQFQKAFLYKTINLDLEVNNQSDEVIDAELQLEESDDFFVGGELKSQISFMPGEKYIFRYNIIPLQIGRLSLPKFNISEIMDQDRLIPIIKGFTKKCLIIK